MQRRRRSISPCRVRARKPARAKAAVQKVGKPPVTAGGYLYLGWCRFLLASRPLVHPTSHLIFRHVFDVGCKTPLVAEWIGQRTHPVAPELVLNRAQLPGAGVDRGFERS